MIDSLSPWMRRLLALALLAFALLVVDAGIFSSWRAQRAAYQAGAQTDRQLAARYLKGLATLKAKVDEAQKLQDNETLQAMFLDPAAAEQLQDVIKSAASTGELEITSLQVLPMSEAGSLRKQGLQVVLQGDFTSLVRFVQTIETTSPLIRLSELEIQRADDDHNGVRVAFTAEGLVREANP